MFETLKKIDILASRKKVHTEKKSDKNNEVQFWKETRQDKTKTRWRPSPKLHLKPLSSQKIGRYPDSIAYPPHPFKKNTSTNIC